MYQMFHWTCNSGMFVLCFSVGWAYSCHGYLEVTWSEQPFVFSWWSYRSIASHWPFIASHWPFAIPMVNFIIPLSHPIDHLPPHLFFPLSIHPIPLFICPIPLFICPITLSICPFPLTICTFPLNTYIIPFGFIPFHIGHCNANLNYAMRTPNLLYPFLE